MCTHVCRNTQGRGTESLLRPPGGHRRSRLSGCEPGCRDHNCHRPLLLWGAGPAQAPPLHAALSSSLRLKASVPTEDRSVTPRGWAHFCLLCQGQASSSRSRRVYTRTLELCLALFLQSLPCHLNTELAAVSGQGGGGPQGLKFSGVVSKVERCGTIYPGTLSPGIWPGCLVHLPGRWGTRRLIARICPFFYWKRHFITFWNS